MAGNIISANVTLVNGVPMVSSLEVAERFEKSHDNVLKAIKRIIDDLNSDITDVKNNASKSDFAGRNFALSEYLDPTGRKLPMYQLTRDAFSLLAMGFTGAKALAWKVRYIEAFNAMEAELTKRSASQKPLRNRQASLPGKDKYEAYIEEVEAFRATTMAGIDRLIRNGLGLMDIYRFGPAPFTPYNDILMRWLMEVVVHPSALFDNGWRNTEYAIAHSPIGLVRELEKRLPDMRK